MTPSPPAESSFRRLRLSLFGAVQGVGFRPFVFRLAEDMRLSGWVLNGPFGVVIEVDGNEQALRLFASRVEKEKPPAAVLAAVETVWLEPSGFQGFHIKESEVSASASAWLLPDLATCPECLAEISQSGERRQGYAFTNCTLCGPRFTIVTDIPYDRPNTSMAGFPLCAKCRAEYENPRDRRFHAQPIACPDCGPKLWLEREGPNRETGPSLDRAAALLRQGDILALKGIGGFLLLCDARSQKAVERLRRRKRRQKKPFAVMFPDLESVRRNCDVSPLEAEWLASTAAPIVILRRGPDAEVAKSVAPGNPWLGAMLPYAPLHHLLMGLLKFPVIATSANLSEEPMAKDNAEAKTRLKGIADAFLMHDRPIVRHADDSIVRLARGRQLVLRRARGLAPLPLRISRPLRPVLALGAHLKSTVAIAWDRQIVVSQHIGDLETAASLAAFRDAVTDLCRLYGFNPQVVACDMHPDYASSRFAETLGLPVARIQHHHAHAAACMADLDIAPPALAIVWDGLGLGTDNTIWGGEFLIIRDNSFERFGHLRTFPLPGAEAAIREPRRCALGLLYEMGADLGRLRPCFPRDWEAAQKLPSSRAFSPRTSSMGRLFDGLASLTGLRQANAFEGQAAMSLEHCLDAGETGAYPFPLAGAAPRIADWEPLLRAALEDIGRGVAPGVISARFHNALARLVLEAARQAGLQRVVLSGGVFQNAYLSAQVCALLEEAGFQAHTHQRLPPNDGGISAGQAYIAGLGWLD
ncbi:MAG TPA: carbamoyltransferase HypF [Elusimicrobia bacterium]|nr:carbamoyltransferase HypF [Elusimicrobiota bacterium]HBT60444.1 carbamoyltransferase HypF [Elusimicrobiota bacterium]